MRYYEVQIPVRIKRLFHGEDNFEEEETESVLSISVKAESSGWATSQIKDVIEDLIKEKHYPRLGDF